MEPKVETNEIRPMRYRGLFYWMQSMVMMFLPVLFLATFIGTPLAVAGGSMSPTLHDGEYMIVRSVFYSPERGDMIVFARDDFLDGRALVKRVIAVAGDLVHINTETNTVYVNGIALDEPYISEPTSQAGDMNYPHMVPWGYVFVLGDNRSPNGSLDSRSASLGLVDEREIIGQVVAVVLPLGRARLFLG